MCKYESTERILHIGHEDADQFSRNMIVSFKNEGKSPWLSIMKCSVCGQYGLIAKEDLQNDIICIKKINQVPQDINNKSTIWNDEYSHYETLLQIGYNAGCRVHFKNPKEDQFLRKAMKILIEENPDIPVAKIAKLLNLDEEMVKVIKSSIEGGNQ